MSNTHTTAMLRAKRAVIFDVFHTLTSVESSWGCGLPSMSEMLGVNRRAWHEQLLEKSRERLVGIKTDPFAIIAEMAYAIDPAIPEDHIARMAAAITDIPAETVRVLETLRGAETARGQGQR